jgi:hypothetical protein
MKERDYLGFWTARERRQAATAGERPRVTDESQVMALADWFAANGRVMSVRADETEAQAAIRGLEAIERSADTLMFVHHALATALQAPSESNIAALVGAIVDENDALRKALAEAVDHMGKSGHPSRIHGMVEGWRSALLRSWASPFRGRSVPVRISVSAAEVDTFLSSLIAQNHDGS